MPVMQNAKFKMQKKLRRRGRTAILFLHFAFCILNYTPALTAQQPLDKLLARIGTTPITHTDVLAAVGLGLVDATSANDPAAVSQVIDRQLMLIEVTRFPPPEPSAAAVDQQLAMMKKQAADSLPALMRATGLDETRLRDIARDTLRIQGYVAQRFGTSRQVGEDEVRRYYDEHQAQFTRNGKVIPFEDAEPEARRLAAAARLRDAIMQWVHDLRMRAEVVEVGKK
jgi:hypothetical protein